MNKHIAIIGGGASGLMAACIAAESGAFVTIFERGDKLGKKLVTTGNGRGNFTNLDMNYSYFRSNTIEYMEQYLEQFSLQDVLSFFDQHGMRYKDRQGYFYPYSGQATALLQVFTGVLEQSDQVEIKLESKVSSITYLENGQVELLSKKKAYVFDKVIVATGSKAAPKTGSDGTGYYLLEKLGLTLEPVVPALVQLHCAEDYVRKVAGVRVDGEISLYVQGDFVDQSYGELQMTDYGVSGIPVFQISRYAAYALERGEDVVVSIDLFKDDTVETLLAWLLQRTATCGAQDVLSFCSQILNTKLVSLLLDLVGLNTEMLVQVVTPSKWEDFCKLCKRFTLTLTNTHGFDAAQVCAGGLSMQEIDEHMRVKKLPNIYVVGELLDVDGMCGGYNLQWAWTSGYIAGKHAASVDNS